MTTSELSVDDALVTRLRRAGCVFAEDEARLLLAAAADDAALDALVGRRIDGTPLEHLLGWVEVCGRRVAVDPGVFVPRQRTELLIRAARAAVPADGVLVDLCCGSGAIGAVVAGSVPGVRVHAVDLDPAAVRCARRNLRGAAGRVYCGDLYAALPRQLLGRVDVIVANAPYVPTAALHLMPREARDHEPRLALHGGPDGLEVQRRVVAGARPWLAAGGHLLVETSAEQAAGTVALFRAAGFSATVKACTDTRVVSS